MSLPAEILVPFRWRRWLMGPRICCPFGHRIKPDFHIPEHGMVRCNHRVQGLSCNQWVFIVHIRGGGNIVVAVSPEEKAEMSKLATPAEMLDYLGIFADTHR
jgi:hypothetical protein